MKSRKAWGYLIGRIWYVGWYEPDGSKRKKSWRPKKMAANDFAPCKSVELVQGVSGGFRSKPWGKFREDYECRKLMTAAYVLARARRPTFEQSNVDSGPSWPPVPTQPDRTVPQRKPAFPFWISGPVTGACVGLAVVTASFVAWAHHGFPDMLFRSGHAAIVSAVIMTVGGALFGLVYGVALLLATRLLDRTIRPLVHFCFAILCSVVVSYVISDISLRRRELVGMDIAMAVIVVTSFVVALTTTVRSDTHREQ